MFIIIFAGATALILGLLIGFYERSVLEGIMGGFISGILGLLIGFFISLIAMACLESSDEKSITIEESAIELIELEDNYYVSMQNINSNWVYTYRYIDENGDVITKSIDADACDMRYTQSNILSIQVNRPKSDTSNWLFGALYNTKEYVFYIPEDSVVIEKYSINT